MIVCPICNDEGTLWKGGQGGDYEPCECKKISKKTIHSPELSEKILELSKILIEGREPSGDFQTYVVDSILSMGPLCFFDDMENEDEAKGAIKTLDWIITGLK